MKFWQAMRAVEKGYKVRCNGFLEGHWMDKSYNGMFAQEKMDLFLFIQDKWEFFEFPDSIKKHFSKKLLQTPKRIMIDGVIKEIYES